MKQTTFFWLLFLVACLAALGAEYVLLDGRSTTASRLAFDRQEAEADKTQADEPPGNPSSRPDPETARANRTAPVIERRSEKTDASASTSADVRKQLEDKVNSLQAALASAQDKADRDRRDAAAALSASQRADAEHQAKLEDSHRRMTVVASEQADRTKASIAAALHASESADAEHRAQLDDAQKRLAAAAVEQATAKGEALQAAKRLTAQRIEGNALHASLVSAKAKADQIGREKAAAVAALRASEGANADRKAKLEEAQKRTAALTGELTGTKREVVQATKRLADLRAEGSALQASLAATKAKADQADRERAAAVAALHKSERADAARQAKLEDARKRTADLTDRLADVRRESSHEIEAARRVAAERVEGSALQASLASAQDKVDQADREKAAAVTALHTSESADADHRAKLEDALKRTTALSNELAVAKREAAQANEASKHLASERAEGSALQAALASAQADAARAGREKAAAVAARNASESADADHRAKLEDALKRSANLSEELVHARRETAQASETARHLASERAEGDARQAALASTRAKADQADREKVAAVAARKASESADADSKSKLEDARHRMAALTAELSGAKREAAQATAKRNENVGAEKEAALSSSDRSPDPSLRLPDGGMVHVVLHYPMPGDAARTQAVAVKSKLGDLATDVTDLSTPQSGSAHRTVTYYYKQDEGVAARIADRIEAPEPVRTRISTDRLPRPGTIEVSLGGKQTKSKASP